MSRASRITFNPHDITAVLFHAQATPLPRRLLPGGYLLRARNVGPNRDLNRTSIPQEGCGKVLGFPRKLADRSERGLEPLLSGAYLSVSPLLSELKGGGPTGI